ncbi:MAG: Na/Pi cotransporter family protein, partial [Planctomycetota bacterium]
LTQAIGVILGANIGTTITGWILVVKIGKYGLPLLGISTFFYLFSKKDTIRFFAMFLVGLGMVFFGLQLMKHGFAPIKELPGFEAWFHKFQPDTYLGVWKCVMVGAVLTAIVQSSSATLGITMALALTGAINFHTAAALILGENIGTTITAFLASLGAFTNARRAAYAHVIFNLLGVCWITLLFVPYTNLIDRVITKTQVCDTPAIVALQESDPKVVEYASRYKIPEKALYFTGSNGEHVNSAGDILGEEDSYVRAEDFKQSVEKHKLTDLPLYTTHGVEYPFTQSAIAYTHSGFNIVNTLLFLPFVGILSRFLMWLVPDRKTVEKPHLTYLNVRMLDTPAIALEQSYKELIKMGTMSTAMLHEFKPVISNADPDPAVTQAIFQKENDLDVIQKEIVEFIGDMMAGNVTHEITQEASAHLRMADELESISDYVQNLLKLRLKARDTEQQFSQGGLEDLTTLHANVAEYLDMTCEAISHKNKTSDFFSEMQTKGLAVTNLMKECRTRHLVEVGKSQVNPLMSLIYTDMLTAYRRIKDHAFNIAEVLIGEK